MTIVMPPTPHRALRILAFMASLGLFVVCIDDVFAQAAAQSIALANTNLIVNGDAEVTPLPVYSTTSASTLATVGVPPTNSPYTPATIPAPCTNDWAAVTTVPGWTVTQGSPSIVCYSIQGMSNMPHMPAAGNRAFFAAGPYGDSGMAQRIDVASAHETIDTGTVTFTLKGSLGGYTSYAGAAVVSVAFLNQQGQQLGSTVRLTGGTPAERQYVTDFLPASTQGKVPAGTRSINVLVQFINNWVWDALGGHNSQTGYADDLSLTLSTAVSPQPALKVPYSLVPGFDHVFVVMMENTSYSQVIGDNTDAPYINGTLAPMGTLLSNYSAVYHPSDENYLAIVAGDALARGSAGWPNIASSALNLADRLEEGTRTEAAKHAWATYIEGMGNGAICVLAPSNPTAGSHYFYSDFFPDDSPFPNFTDIVGTGDAKAANWIAPQRCKDHVFDLGLLTTDLQNGNAANSGNVARFVWVSPDDWDNGEKSGNGNAQSLFIQDQWLKTTTQLIFNSYAWKNQNSLLILTWDESSEGAFPSIQDIATGLINQRAENSNGSLVDKTNHVATILIGSQPGLVRQGFVSHANYNHYSTAHTIEDALGLKTLNQRLTMNDAYAQPINDAFRQVPQPSYSGLATPTPVVSKGALMTFVLPKSLPATANAKDWLGIYPVGVNPADSPAPARSHWVYAPTPSTTVQYNTSDLAPGQYAAWFFLNDSYIVYDGPVYFTVQ